MKTANVLGSLAAALLPTIANACGGGDDDSCYGPTNNVEYVRQVKRMQPGAPGAVSGPKKPLEWGQVNFLHTVRTVNWPFYLLAICISIFLFSSKHPQLTTHHI